MHAADKANSERHVKTVAFNGENRLKLANMITSQNARIARNGAWAFYEQCRFKAP
jgi:hypothetical protein